MEYYNPIYVPIFGNRERPIRHINLLDLIRNLGYNIEGREVAPDGFYIKYIILKHAYCNAGHTYLNHNMNLDVCPKSIQLSNSSALARITDNFTIKYCPECGKYQSLQVLIDLDHNDDFSDISIEVDSPSNNDNIAGVVVELAFKGDPKIERIVSYDLAPLFNTMQQHLSIPKEVVVLNNKPFNVYSLFGKEVIGGCLKVTKIIVDGVSVTKGDLIYTPDGEIGRAIEDGVATAVLDVLPKTFIDHASFYAKDIDGQPLGGYIECWFDKKQKVLKCQIRNSDDYINNNIIGVVVDFSYIKVEKDTSLLLDQMIVYQSRRKGQSDISSFTLDSLANPEHVKKLDWHHITNSKKTGVKLSKLLVLMHLMNQKNQ